MLNCILIQNRFSAVLINKCTRYSTREHTASDAKTIAEQFSDSIKRIKAAKVPRGRKSDNEEHPHKLLKPDDDYTPRFQYNGYLKNSSWRYYEGGQKSPKLPETEAQLKYKELKKHKFCVLMSFAGGKYYGMQINEEKNTIEGYVLEAMAKNEWILKEHVKQPWLMGFQRGSRTDRGVSAARMNISLFLPKDVNITDLNRDLPADIRMIGMKRCSRNFDARFNCNARTYSYTLPTIAFADYNDQTAMKEYRITSERLQRANDILTLFKGQTNFHNYTVDKLFFDRSSQRRIDDIQCSQPFVERDIEFARITIKGESFMMHQIRKMVGFSLAVIRGVVDDDMLQRSLTKEIFHTPTAPGLGLMLERLHFCEYSRKQKHYDALTFEEFDGDVEKFRSEQIHPVIVQTEIEEQSMLNWLEYLCIHTFDAHSRAREEGRRFRFDPEFEDDWGEDKQFLSKCKSRFEE